MAWHWTPYSVLLMIGGAVCIGLATYLWRRVGPAISKTAALLLLALAVWSIGYGAEISFLDLEPKILWAKVEYLGIVFVPWAWLLFALQYSGREPAAFAAGQESRYRRRAVLALLALEPAVILALAWTNEIHHLIWRETGLDPAGPFVALALDYGPAFWVHWVSSYVCLVIGSTVLVREFSTSSGPYRQQSVSLLLAGIAPWVGNALYVLRLVPVRNLDLTPFGFLASAFALTWALLRFRLFDIVPVANQAVIDGMDDGIVVLDVRDRILRLNPGAQRLLRLTPDDVVGRPASRAFAAHPGLLQPYRAIVRAQAAGASSTSPARWQGDVSSGGSYFDLRIVSLQDGRGRPAGYLLALRDISDRVKAEEMIRLQRDLAVTLSAASNLAVALSHVLDAACRVAPIDCGGVYLVDGATGELALAAHRGLTPEFVELTVRYGADSYHGRLVAAGEPRYGHYAELIPVVDAIRRREALRALAVIPIQHAGRTIAALTLGTHAQDEIPLDVRQILETVAAQVGSAIVRLQAEDRVRAGLHEKEILLREINHRVKNNLQVISSLLYWQIDYVQDEQALAALEDSRNRLRSMALVHEQLSSSPDLSRVSLADYIAALTAYLAPATNLPAQEVIFTVDAGGVILGLETATPCALIIHELVSNALRHAFPPSFRAGRGPGACQIDIAVQARGDTFALTVHDNGVGMPADLDPRTARSLGLQLVCMLVEQLDGSIALHRNGGTTFEITFTERHYKRRI